MSSCCACCCFYPKYKRKVDNIYPRQSDAPLVKNEVDKLLYYATVHPEKLSKIGEYLYQNLKWALNNGYKYAKYTENTIEALESILLAITPQNLNYYAPTYLKVIQKLLEQGYGLGAQMQPVSQSAMSNTSSYGTLNTTSNESLRYQKRAAGLFQKFCEKESSNLSNYNLNFDQFVCQFSSLCFNNNKEDSTRAEIRSSGLQCLATMVQRLVPDDNLRAGYIWDNMDKIVAGILFIIHERYMARHKSSSQLDHSDYDYHEDEQELAEYIYGELYMSTRLRQSMERVDSAASVEFKRKSQLADEDQVVINLNEKKTKSEALEPEHEAKTLLKNICTKADYTTISKIVVPILDFLDDNGQHGWHLAKFVRCIFLIVIYNVRQQHAFVVRELLKHLDSHRNSRALLKCHIIRTIILCTKISAMQSVGTTSQIIDIFNNLLKHLNISVEKAYNLTTRKADNLTDENKLQKEIISAMRQFTQNMPDYAKNDILVFFARQINTQQFSYFELSGNSQADKNELELLNGRKRAKYYECLYEICTKYKPVQVFGAFGSQQFLEDSLKLILVNDYASRKKANEILQLLIDKYHMLDRIQALKPGTYRLVPVLRKNFKSATSLTESSLSLNNQHTPPKLSQQSISRNQTFLSQLSLDDKTKNRSSREDSMFMRKHGRAILSHFNEYLFIANNRRENYESAYVTLSLIVIGFFNDREFVGDFVRFGFYLQDLALLNHDSDTFTFGLQCSVHKFICAFFLLVAKSSCMADLYDYVSQVCDLRRRKDLYKFVYPEYILLDSAGDSGIQSQVSSFSEIESELRKDMAESAKEYRAYVDRLSRHTDNEIEWSVKLSPWMFDKKRVQQILLRNNVSKNVLATDAEFTLSGSYMQTLACVHSALRHRDPYSSESETGSDEAFSRGHLRGYSGISQSNQTPRRSIDMNSMDDDTSYDSTSQVSIDQGFELEPRLKENMRFFIDDNQATIGSTHAPRTNYVDFTSFDTIRRMLFNSGSNMNASNLSNSGLGVGSSTIGPGSSIMPVTSAGIAINVTGEDQEEKNQRIIRDFYQMPFDELKQNLLRTNQTLVCSEKYQQVLDHVSKDLRNGAICDAYWDANKSNASMSSMSTNASLQSHLNKENFNQNKSMALGDIDFPKLFIN